MVLFVVFVIAIPGFFIIRKRRMKVELDAWLPEAGWTPATCPAVFERPMSEARCFDGKLGSRPATLILGRRWQGETANIPRGSGIAQESLVGVKVEGVDAAWSDRWKKKLGYGGTDPVRVDGGLVMWHGLWERGFVAARLNDVQASLE